MRQTRISPDASRSAFSREAAWTRATYLAIALITVAAFSPVLANDFVDLDDDLYVTENPHVLTGLTGTNVAWALTALHAHNWHPLTWLSLQWDVQLFGPRPWGFHLTNLLLHVASSLLLLYVLRDMTGALGRSAVVAALFAVHPLHVESVAWVAERKDVLSALFWMLTLLAYRRYTQSPTWRRYAFLIVVFTLGLMAKPMLVTLPCVLLLLDYWPLCRFPKGSRFFVSDTHLSTPAEPSASFLRLLGEKVPLLALALACAAVTVAAQKHIVHNLTKFPLDIRVMNALTTYVTYLWQMVWPLRLADFYPHQGANLPWWQALLAGSVLAAIIVFVWRQGRRFPYLPVGWLWYLGTLIPVIGLVQVGMQAQADRYTYIPLIGIFMLIAWGVPDWAGSWPMARSALAPLAACWIIMCAALTWVQAGYWQNGATLAQHAVLVTKDNYLSHIALGSHLLRESQFEAAARQFTAAVQVKPDYAIAHWQLGVALSRQGRWEDAIRSYTKALELNPQLADAHVSMGMAFSRQGRDDEAAREFSRALALQPDNGEAHLNLGVALSRQGKWDQALDHFSEAKRLLPSAVEPLMNLGLTLARQGKNGQAAEQFELAIALKPRYPEGFHQLAMVQGRVGKWRDALLSDQQSISLEPRDFRYHASCGHALLKLGQGVAAAEQFRQANQLDSNWLAALNQAARLLATHVDAGSRDGLLAIDLAEELCSATENLNADYLATLAAAYAEAGRFADAISTARQARDLAIAKQPELGRRLEDALRLYEHQQPLREKRGSRSS